MTHRAITAPLRWGLRENLPQFLLLVAVNALVGATLGQERTVLPLLATEEFGLDHYSGALTYILAFGLAKAGANYLAGTLSDRHGRKPVLVAGWVLALPVPVLLILAPTWGWVVAANVLLGISQGLTWSTTVVMKMDLVGPHRRGTAMGLNEAAGYLGVAGTAMATGYLAEVYGLRPAPFLLGAAFIALGLGLSVLLVRETRDHARHEPGGTRHRDAESRSDREVFVLTSVRDRSLSSISQAGLVNNLNDGLAWGLFPVLFATAALPLGQVGLLAAIYPATWGGAQLVTGSLSDRWGRKGLIVAGMLTQALALVLIAAGSTFPAWLGAMALLGVGTAMVYPTLLAGVGDVAHPSWRARAVGVYRLWRDGGFAIGALVAGITADALGLEAAILIVAALTAASGLVVALRMRPTDHLPTPALHTPGGT
ncbi:MFS transporter [Brachybacterium sp. J144]|uniref:MFS transporter n=1 Tax=Brachybacterium sp. J144 TaxID=3116487 RepID=UPI002E79951E|nr:MFS transporter [Brachybacterium sp. J144]MEE1651391.1 MFS transporter [Brachybacterium sp. J144]